jgi:serine O-acetyltransferase
MDRDQLNELRSSIAEALVQSVVEFPQTQHLNRVDLPSRDTIIKCVGLLRQIMYPGYFGQQTLTDKTLAHRIAALTHELFDLLYEQICCSLRYGKQIPGTDGDQQAIEAVDHRTAEVVLEFFQRLPSVRALLAEDVQAAFDGDPAAQSTDETIYCYPGVLAITVQRLAHVLWTLGVPLLPRVMTEHAHGLTGIDIHPGAKLGRRFFIDHGTGVVIGETTLIGDNVKIYQGVTLGALSPAFGQLLRGRKRHPTIEDNVTIYAGATILGGETVIGTGSVIGGNVFITSSVPPHNQVSAESPKLKYRDRRPRGNKPVPLDFQI